MLYIAPHACNSQACKMATATIPAEAQHFAPSTDKDLTADTLSQLTTTRPDNSASEDEISKLTVVTVDTKVQMKKNTIPTKNPDTVHLQKSGRRNIIAVYIRT